MRSKKTKRAGFTCRELPLNFAIFLMSLAIVFPAYAAVKEGARNGFTVQELIGTAVIRLAAGLSVGLCLILFLLAIFWIVAGLHIGFELLKTRSLQRRNDHDFRKKQ